MEFDSTLEGPAAAVSGAKGLDDSTPDPESLSCLERSVHYLKSAIRRSSAVTYTNHSVQSACKAAASLVQTGRARLASPFVFGMVRCL